MSTLHTMLYGGFTPTWNVARVRRHNPDKDPTKDVIKVRKQQSPTPERLAWFIEFNKMRHLKQGIENQARVLAALNENPGVTTRQLADVMKCSVTMANNHLQALIKAGEAYKARRSLPRGGFQMLYFASKK